MVGITTTSPAIFATTSDSEENNWLNRLADTVHLANMKPAYSHFVGRSRCAV